MYPVSLFHIFLEVFRMRIYRAVHIYLVLNELLKPGGTNYRALGDRCTIRCPRPVRRHDRYSNSSFLQRKLSNKDILPECLRGDSSHVTAIKSNSSVQQLSTTSCSPDIAAPMVLRESAWLCSRQ